MENRFARNAQALLHQSGVAWPTPTQIQQLKTALAVEQESDSTFSFRVLFVAGDSKESADRTFGMMRQADGSWLFARSGLQIMAALGTHLPNQGTWASLFRRHGPN